MARHHGPFRSDPSQFRAVAADVMRQVLVDHARRRGSGAPRVVPDGSVTPMADSGPASPDGLDLVTLDEALRTPSTRHERQARIVERRFFGGLTVDQAADMLGVSRGTVINDWTVTGPSRGPGFSAN